ncbi:MAG: thioesterase [Planctomycetes bacterium]|nr:thioesterase [Planctomycetota bacterium]
MAHRASDNLWIACHKPKPAAAVGLFCFPHAGGSAASFRLWGWETPDTVEVFPIQYPGRQNRFREPPYTRLLDLVADLTAELEPLLAPPFALFGHSLGALVAFEVARHLRRQGSTLPQHLFLSGRAAPHLRSDEPPIHTLPDPLLVDEVSRRYQGIPDVVLQNQELLALLLPMLRADIAMAETYQCRDEPPLDCPMTVFGGVDDTIDQDELDAWRAYTTRQFAVRMLPGDHFFFDSARRLLLPAILEVIQA